MFTGIIEELGQVVNLRLLPSSAQLTLSACHILSDIHLGDSIAVNGACLTVIAFDRQQFTVDIMKETLERTNLGALKTGSKVNMERAMQLNSRLGGHLVSGHIDGTGIIGGISTVGIAQIINILPQDPALLAGILSKGSIAIDGISLTVVEVTDSRFSVSLIPHTSQMTTLGFKKVGDQVNL